MGNKEVIRLLAGDCRDVLATLPDASVHCVVTSPPYYGLRDYQTASWEGGRGDCDHFQASRRMGSATTLRSDGREHTGPYDGEKALVTPMPFRDTCGKCGATRVDRQIGLEHSPEAYLQTMVQVFRQIRRVLRPDGTVWCNIGDSYASGEVGRHDGYNPTGNSNKPFGAREQRARTTKPKDLLLMPARLALALQADGWWVRSDIIWHKPNPMPESCTDRPTSAHEHMFLLTRSARYFYDADAVREEREPDSLRRSELYGANPSEAKWNPDRNDGGRGGSMGFNGNPAGRNLRNVWTIATHAYSAAHFATFPPELASRCIRAGTSERGCCAQCGAPWRRVVERDSRQEQASWSGAGRANGCLAGGGHVGRTGTWTAETTTTGWSPSCTHDAAVVPATVLDPFFGAGTTGLVSDRLGRDCIGIDLNPDYNAMSRARITDDAPLFAAFPVADPAEERQAELWAGDVYQQLPALRSKPMQVPRGWDTGPGAHGTIHRNGRTGAEAAD